MQENMQEGNTAGVFDNKLNIGNVCRDRGEIDQAEDYYQKALEGYEYLFGRVHVKTLVAISNLGQLYTQQGRLTEAEPLVREALTGEERLLGPLNESTLLSLNSLGNLFEKQRNYQEAENIYSEALAGAEKALGPEHTVTLQALHSLGALHSSLQKYGEAERVIEKAAQGRDAVYGPEHSTTLSSIQVLAVIYKNLGKTEAAEESYNRAWSGLKQALGADHKTTLSTGYGLGLFYSEQGKHAQAEEILREVLEGEKRTYGADDTSTLTTLSELANLCRRQSKYDESLSLYQRTLRGRENALGADHKTTLDTHYSLAIVHKEMENFRPALSSYKAAEEGYRRTLGAQHPETLEAIEQRARILGRMRLFDEAGEAYEQLVQGRKASLGPEHADTLKSISDLAELRALQDASQAQVPARPRQQPGKPQRKPLHNLQTLNRMLKEQAMKERENETFMSEGRRETDRSMLEGSARSSEPSDLEASPPARPIKSPDTLDRANSKIFRWDFNLTQSLLKDRQHLNQYDLGGFTPLAWALKTNQLDLVRQFIDIGADVNVKGRDSSTALLIAARRSSPDILQYLLDHGADACVQDSRGNTPIHIAVVNPNSNVLDTLLSYYKCYQLPGIPAAVSVDALNNDGWTALHLALPLPDPARKITLLLQHGASPSLPSANGDQAALHMAAKSGHVVGAQALLDFSDDLVQSGASRSTINDFSPDGFTPLHLAILENHEAMVTLLLSRGADINLPFLLDDSTPLLYCLENGRLHIAKLFFTSPSTTAEIDVTRPDALGWTPLHIAALKGHENLLRLMLECPGADVEVRNAMQSTPLHCAVAGGWDACVRLLLECGADGSAVDGVSVDEAWPRTDEEDRRERDAEQGGNVINEKTKKPSSPSSSSSSSSSTIKIGSTPLDLARRAALGSACVRVLAEFGYTDPDLGVDQGIRRGGCGGATTSTPSFVLLNAAADTDGASLLDATTVAGRVGEKEKEFV